MNDDTPSVAGRPRSGLVARPPCVLRDTSGTAAISTVGFVTACLLDGSQDAIFGIFLLPLFLVGGVLIALPGFAMIAQLPAPAARWSRRGAYAIAVIGSIGLVGVTLVHTRPAARLARVGLSPIPEGLRELHCDADERMTDGANYLFAFRADDAAVRSLAERLHLEPGDRNSVMPDDLVNSILNGRAGFAIPKRASYWRSDRERLVRDLDSDRSWLWIDRLSDRMFP